MYSRHDPMPSVQSERRTIVAFSIDLSYLVRGEFSFAFEYSNQLFGYLDSGNGIHENSKIKKCTLVVKACVKVPRLRAHHCESYK